ncbi:MAG: NAD(P)H-dependent oxidoreductase subunit E [Armatimonadetes bacterium]|nr:NAD(P)H-dependent oxidoreductase subunit E [Armatimonadota bacterium]
MSDVVTLSPERPKAPRPEELELKFGQRACEELEKLKGHYPDLKSCILPCLWIAQREYGGWLPPAAVAEVAHRLGRSFAEVEGVATFYSMYNTDHLPGRHLIEVCTCLSCHLCGAYRIVDHLEDRLGVKLGETTPDGVFTIHEVECLDACDRAPLLQVGDRYVGPVTPESVDALLDELRGREDSTVVQLADSVVQVHLDR